MRSLERCWGYQNWRGQNPKDKWSTRRWAAILRAAFILRALADPGIVRDWERQKTIAQRCKVLVKTWLKWKTKIEVSPPELKNLEWRRQRELALLTSLILGSMLHWSIFLKSYAMRKSLKTLTKSRNHLKTDRSIWTFLSAMGIMENKDLLRRENPTINSRLWVNAPKNNTLREMNNRNKVSHTKIASQLQKLRFTMIFPTQILH